MRPEFKALEAPTEKMSLLKPTLHIEVLVKAPSLQQIDVQQASHPGAFGGTVLTPKSYV